LSGHTKKQKALKKGLSLEEEEGNLAKFGLLGHIHSVRFGNLAIIAYALDPWLCVSTFRWIYPF
jgi:hypothetical protein